MALRSMTGFGQAEASTRSGTYRVEIRSVNNRFLDVQLRLPKALSSLEARVKQQVSSSVARGYVNVNITCGGGTSETRLTWDRASVASYVGIFREVIAEHKLEGGITLSDLLKFSDFVKAEGGERSEEEAWGELGPVIGAALKAFQKAREVEGDHTEQDLRKSLKTLAGALKKIEARAPQRIKAYEKDLRARVSKLLDGSERIDESRVAIEIAMMADKLDVDEECVRLRGHIKAFETALASEEPVGKQLGFLLQELNREANTICSKANDSQISQWGVTLKESIERIREQLQNIE